MILGFDEIKNRLDKGQIFRPGTWESSSIKEASYALRIANDGMIVDGQKFSPGEIYPEFPIEVKPGRIAIFSTIECLCMPDNIAGRLGIRLDFASRGLTGLMGIQVDPFYGQDYPDERLYIKVANFGNETVKINHQDLVFNIEFSEVKGAKKPQQARQRTWSRIIENLVDQEHSDWTYVTRIQSELKTQSDTFDKNMDSLEKSIDVRLSSVRDNQQSVVMFGVFLVAITILGVMLTLILNTKNAPDWVTHGGWIALIALFIVATGAIVVFITIAAVGFCRTTRRDYKSR